MIFFEKWNAIILNSPDFYTIAHNPSLIGFLHKAFNWKGESYFIIQDEQILGVYQHSFPSNNKSVSMPHFSYGGIIRKDTKVSKKEIFNAISQYFLCSFEIRDFLSYTPFYDESKVATFLELEDTADKQMAYFKSNHRRKIKKAYKNQLYVNTENSLDALLKFYDVYSRNMLRLGSPVLSKKFFIALFKNYDYGEIKVFLIYYDNQVIGGALMLTYNDFAEDCWLSTLSQYNYLYTSVLLYWEMIKYSIENRIKIFSFGRSTDDSTLLHFKKQWKPVEKRIYFSYSEPKKMNLRKMKILTNIWKIMPLRVANLIGPPIADRLY